MYKTAVILLFTIACFKASSQEIDSVDYKVYSAVLKANLSKNKKSFVVLHSTTRHQFEPNIALENDSMIQILWGWKRFFKTTTVDSNYFYLYKEFIDIPFQSKKIKSKFYIAPKPVLMSKSAFDDFFLPKDDNGWENFYEKYPDAEGFISFSNVHYSADKKTAILYYSLMRDYLNGRGAVVILSFNGKEWKKKLEGEVWIS